MKFSDFTLRVEKYVDMVQEKNNEYFKMMGYTFADPPKIVPKYGKKYVRIVIVDGLNGCHSVHTFVNSENGDILKGTWKGPVKNGVRGNIFSDDLGANRVSELGPHYLK